MRKLFLSVVVFGTLFTSCRRNNVNIIRIENMCFNGAAYQVDYYVATVDTQNKAYAFTLNAVGGDTLDIHQIRAGNGHGHVTLGTKGHGCRVIIRIVNGPQLQVTEFGNCVHCPN